MELTGEVCSVKQSRSAFESSCVLGETITIQSPLWSRFRFVSGNRFDPTVLSLPHEFKASDFGQKDREDRRDFDHGRDPREHTEPPLLGIDQRF